MNRSRIARIVAVFAFLVPVGGLTYVAFEWFVCRIYVEPGQSAVVTYKGSLFGERKGARPGVWAERGEAGVQKELLGPGRHFVNPIWYSVQTVDDIEILPGQVGVVRCKLGDDLPKGEYLVDGDIGETKFKGILRKVLVAGRYRINPYGYDVEVIGAQNFESGGTAKAAGWVDIPTGYVGVVTNLADNPARRITAGIADMVFQPGIYPINPREQQVDIVEVGYRETSIKVDPVKNRDGAPEVDENGEPKIANEDSGIQFPSADGYKMHLDFTLIWGLMPDQAAHAIRSFGNVKAVETKIIVPQMDSVLRNKGSAYKAVQLLVGTDREKYQNEAVSELHEVLESKKLTGLKGLVRHVYIPAEVRKPIQQAYIADELKLTSLQEQETAKEEANLREAEQKVALATQTVTTQTTKLVATKKAEGERQAEGIKADTLKLTAAIAKETARLSADAERLLGQATNDGKKLQEEATAGRFGLAVQAFGSPEAYNRYIFASGLPDEIDLELIYAGEGTLWTNPGANIGIRANLPINQGAKATTAAPAAIGMEKK